MRQQINLYQPIFSEQRKALSAGSVALGLAVIACALAGVAWYAQRGVGQLEITVQALREQNIKQQEQLEQAGAVRASRAKPVDLELRVRQLTATLSERERALQVLRSGAAGQTSGFAARMEALARRHVPGLWLDGMKLSGTSPSMSLQGATTNPDIVPLYLRSLASDTVLAGTRFDEFIIQRPEPAKDNASGESAAKPKSAAAANAVRFSAGSKSMPSTTEDSTS